MKSNYLILSQTSPINDVKARKADMYNKLDMFLLEIRNMSHSACDIGNYINHDIDQAYYPFLLKIMNIYKCFGK